MKKKKIVAVLMAVVLMFSLAACSSKENNDAPVPTPTEQKIDTIPVPTQAQILTMKPTDEPAVTAAPEEQGKNELVTPALTEDEILEQKKLDSVTLNGGDYKPAIEGEYMYAGKIAAFLPTGWLNNPIQSFIWTEDDLEASGQVDPCSLSFLKGAKDTGDSWTCAGIKIDYSENDYGIWDTRSYYYNIEELDFTAGSYQWTGFIGTDEDGNYKTATLNPDGRGDISVSVTMTNSETGEELSFEDEDLLTILASIRIDDTPANFEYVDFWSGLFGDGSSESAGTEPGDGGQKTPDVTGPDNDGLIYNPFPNSAAKTICDSYSSYLSLLAAEKNCAETLSYEAMFVDGDDIPELVVQTDEDSEVILLRLTDEGEVAEVGRYAFVDDCMFCAIGMNDYIAYGYYDENENEVLEILKYNGVSTEVEAVFIYDEENGSFLINGKSYLEDEAQAILEDYYAGSNEDYSEMYSYYSATEFGSVGTAAYNMAASIDWPESYYEDDESYNVCMEILEGTWSLHSAYLLDFNDDTADSDGILLDNSACTVDFSVVGGNANFSFSYGEDSFDIVKAPILIFNAVNSNSDGDLSWRGEICDEVSEEDGAFIYVYVDESNNDFSELLIVVEHEGESYGYDILFDRAE